MEFSKLSPHAFIQEHGLVTETGQPYSFRNHLFLFDILRDYTPNQVILKAAQVGFSTLAIVKSLWLAKNRGMDIIYTLPTSNDINDFVGGKVNRLISQNPVFQEFVKDKDTIEQKRVGNNLIYYRGTWVEKAALMVSSDLNIHDEEDRSKPEVVAQYSSRLQHSPHKWTWHFSNPSTPGHGVSAYWDRSDRKEWFITCRECRTQQMLVWPSSIDRVLQVYVCKACKRPISDEERRVGVWRPTAPITSEKGLSEPFSGYHISLLMAPWVSAAEILNYADTKSAEFFHNFVLGLPYVGEGNTVTEDIFTRNFTKKVNSQENVIIGCDSGLKKHYVLGNREGLFYYGVTETWADIEAYLRRFKGSVAVIDALPDLTGPRELREKYPGRVFLVSYSKDRKTMQLLRWGEGSEAGHVNADRNRLIQMVIDDFATERVPLQGTAGDWQDYISHWKTLYRVTDKDIVGNPTSIWETSNGMDHWCHATCYYRIGMDRFGRGAGKIFTDSPPPFYERGVEIQPDQTSSFYQLPDKNQVW